LRVWVDVNTPKQVRFFKPIVEELESKGLEVLVTARRFREVEQLARLVGLNYVPVGVYGGPRLEDKLRRSLSRMLKLFKVVRSWRPDVALSFSSPEAARVAYGLGVPHLCVNDSPHAEAVAKLTVPLSAKLFTPKCIPLERWTRYGISADDVVQYDAVDPAAWLKRLPPLEGGRERLIVVRAREAYASYVHGGVDVAVEAARRLVDEALGFKVVVLARYWSQVLELRRRLKGAFIPTKAVDGVSLLSRSTLFIGGGGTMTWEAALLGTPTISCAPVEEVYVEDYMASLGLVRKARMVEEVVEEALKVLSSPDRWVDEQRRRAREALRSMEDPVEVVAGFIESTASRPSSDRA
jgi:predicted glycosyltransferase